MNEIIENYKKARKGGINLRYIDLEKESADDFYNEMRSVSMFEDKKLIALKNAFGNKDFKEEFLKDKKKDQETKNIVIFYERDEVPASDSLSKFLKEKGKSQEFKSLEGAQLKNWIKKEIESYGGKIELSALDEIASAVGNNLWQMENEIKKLVNYKKGGIIKIEDVRLLVRPKIETDIFKTIDAIAQKNKKQALSLIHEHMGKGDPPLYLLSMINFQFRNLLAVKNLIEKNVPYYSIPKISGLHPFVVKKSYFQAGKFTLQELKKIYQKIFQTDLAIKSGKMGAETALDILLLSI